MARQRNHTPAATEPPATPTALAVRNREIRRVRVGDIVDNPKNYRTHDDLQRSSFRATVGEIGWYGYPDVFEHPDFPGRVMLIDGELRSHHLAEHYGPDAFIDVNLTDFSPTEADKALATKDPLAGMAGVEKAALAGLLNELEAGSAEFEALIATLANEEKINLDRRGGEGATGLTDPDEAPELPENPITQHGDLWIMGEHRLLCGNSANATDVARLLNGERANCVFTDPPYGVGIGGKNRFLNDFQKAGRVLIDVVSDDLTPEQLRCELLPSFQLLRSDVMSDECTLFVTAPQGGELGMMMMMMSDAGLRVRHVLIWKKNQPTFSMGRLDYDYAHEPILLTWGKRHKRPMLGDHRTSVWEIDRERKCDVHPTMKPVGLYVNAYLNNSCPGDNVADMFAGSGTAFIAAQKTNRRCFGMEIVPAYCDVCVARWEAYTGQRATRTSLQQELNEPEPEPYPEPAAEPEPPAPARRGRSYDRATGVNPNLPPAPKPATRRGRPRKK